MVFVVGNTGIRLMPTNEYRARKLLKSGRARIFKRNPFMIRLLNRETGETQPVEYKCDTGYGHIGVSVCTEKRELVNAQYDLLKDEPERHNDRRKYRRDRRNRKRYRAPRFDNRRGKISEDGFAPSVRNKRDRHIEIFTRYDSVLPITEAVFEMGQFDTQVLRAVQEGKPLPEGTDYQRGERYGIETLREAVFTRDHHKCLICGKTSSGDGAILRIHHVGFWKQDRSDRLSNLMTVCTRCHTSKNHKPGGKLYGLEPKLSSLSGATFMTMVRWDMLNKLKAAAPDVRFRVTYGAATKLARKALGIQKTHANDAYAMGRCHPKRRTDFHQYKKLRRNNRVLEKFYDARVIDTRTGEKVPGTALGCNRTSRSVPRNNLNNLRIYRGATVSKGYRAIRKSRYPLRPGTVITFNGERHAVKGVHNNGTRAILDTGKSVAIGKVIVVFYPGGWQQVI